MKVVDMHCDTIAALYENKEKGWTLQDNRLHIRLDKMKQGDYLLQNFALFVCTENCEDPYQQALTLADCFDRQVALFSGVRHCFRSRLVRSDAITTFWKIRKTGA